VGPVIVRTSYSIRPERVPDFMDAMVHVRGSRRRTGATQWGLFRAGEKPSEFDEIFTVASWDEHLRQHRDRMTATDLSYLRRARSLSETDPETWHLLPALSFRDHPPNP
jgi:hypothetical protein